MYNLKGILLLLCGIFIFSSCTKQSNRARKVLVFSKTDGFRHASIEPAIMAIEALGADNGFSVTTTEDAAEINGRTA